MEVDSGTHGLIVILLLQERLLFKMSQVLLVLSTGEAEILFLKFPTLQSTWQTDQEFSSQIKNHILNHS